MDIQVFQPDVELDVKSFKWKLLNDPSYIVSFIVQNNPSEVAGRLTNYGIYAQSEDDIITAIGDLINEPEGIGKVMFCLSVPLNYEKFPRAYDQAILEVANENMARFGIQSAGESGELQTRGLSAWGEEGIGLDNILGAVASSLTALTGSSSVGQGPGSYPPAPSQTNNTLQTILWIVAAIIVIIVLLFLFKPKS